MGGSNGELFESMESPVHRRQLRAASSTAELARRGLKIPLQNDMTLHYIEEFAAIIDTPFGAEVHLGSHVPILALEHIEDLIVSVQCNEESIEVVFASYDSVLKIEEALSTEAPFLIITSHWSCNDDGSRLPVYRSLVHQESNAIEFFTNSVGWKNSFQFMKVDFGRKDTKDYNIRPHSHLRRRDPGSLLEKREAGAASGTVSPPLSSVLVSSTTILTPTSNIAFPTIAGTVQATATNVVQDIGAQFINTQILPSNSTLIAAAEGLVIPPGLTISCVNCTTSGSIELLTGSFTVGGNIKDGFAEVAANDMFAHIELDTTWLASLGAASFTINLATIELQPISIPDIAVIGPLFNPRLIIAANVGVDLDFTYGFEVTVPNNSTAIINIGNITESSITGFQDTIFKALPFQSKLGNLALNLSVTLEPQILVGFSFLNGMDTAGAGVFLQLPQLAVEVAPAKGTNEKCEPITNVTLADDIFNLFGNLTHIVPEVQLAGGFILEATLGPKALGGALQTAYTPLATTFSAPTACLAYDKKASTYGPAIIPTTTTAGAISNASSTSAAMALGSPFIDGRSDGFSIQSAIMLLALIFGGFLRF
ncbi:hypothetical protein MMC30_008873 [Trapelia coarctata]|nr:hypothetical protein [Trapelia coarctata]